MSNLIKIKKISFVVICTLFIFSKITFADNLLISANGIKLGDSALKYFDKNFIESEKIFIYKSKDYFMIFVKEEQILIRNNDPEYTIVSVDEGILMSFEDCKKKIKLLDDYILKIVPFVKKKEKGSAENPIKSRSDPSGKSLMFGTDYYFNESAENGSMIRTNCTDWSAEIENNRHWQDNLGKSINSKEFNLFIIKLYGSEVF